MHGLRGPMYGEPHKGYLVSLMEDASRLITHSAFCPGETVPTVPSEQSAKESATPKPAERRK